MTKYERAKEKLRSIAVLSQPEQLTLRAEIDDAFPVFWDGNPTKEEFSYACSGLVLTCGALYVMVKGSKADADRPNC